MCGYLCSSRYPSLLESSDVEGGSTAAVLTYLYRILASVDQEDLVQRILHFLLASTSDSDAQIAEKKKNMSASRRKSLDVLAAFSEEAARPSPSLFNLRDLALLGLRSTNRPTILATLRLLTVILQRHSSFARFLIRTIPGQPAKQRTVGALNAELEQLLTMATSIMDEPMLDESFENYLKDASWILESRLYFPPPGTSPGEVVPLEIRQDDLIVGELLDCLKTFFTNTVIVNLALTEVLMSIASSNLMALDGWLLVDPTKYSYTKTEGALKTDHMTDILDQVHSVYQVPSWSSADIPALTAVLLRLVEKVQEWRKQVPDFDILVAARRDLLHEAEEPPSNTEQISGTSTTIFSADRNSLSTPRKLQLGSEPGTPRGRRDLRNITSPQRSIVGSPLREPTTFHTPPPPDDPESRSFVAEELRKRLATPFFPNSETPTKPDQPTEDGAQETGEPGQVAPDTNTSAIDGEQKAKDETASLGHVLTNVVILYEFLLEISAVVQARGTLFDEAGFQDLGFAPQADDL